MSRELAELKSIVKGLAGAVEALAGEVRALTAGARGLTPERRLAIKRIARASALGDPGPRREWNRQRRQELDAER